MIQIATMSLPEPIATFSSPDVLVEYLNISQIYIQKLTEKHASIHVTEPCCCKFARDVTRKKHVNIELCAKGSSSRENIWSGPRLSKT